MRGGSASTREAESTVFEYITKIVFTDSKRLGSADRRIQGKNETQGLFLWILADLLFFLSRRYMSSVNFDSTHDGKSIGAVT